MGKTKIEWTGSTWNPTTGCSVATAGCTNCYAMRQAARIQGFGNASYQGLTKSTRGGPVWTGKVRQASQAQVRRPLSMRTPSLIFVNSMSDLFHPDMEEKWLDDAFDVMRAAPRHTYQILTKRPEVAAAYYAKRPHLHNLPQVWLGVSVERADVLWRIDELRKIPVRIRFLSVEPLIGSVMPLDLAGIHWTIVGGESGPGARPCKPEWVREVRGACEAAGVPLFLKQFGKWPNNPFVAEQGMTIEAAMLKDLAPTAKGGATLDGRLYRDFPS